MSCKLFDISAFADHHKIRLFPPEDCGRDAVAEAFGWRKLLREATVLDVSAVEPAWAEWLERPGKYEDELVRVTSPWGNCFVYGGLDDSMRGIPPFEWGVQVKAIDKPALDRIASGSVLCGKSAIALSEAASGLMMRLWTKVANRTEACLWPKALALIDGAGKLQARIAIGMQCTSGEIAPQLSLPLFAFQLMHCRNIETCESVYRPHMPKGRRNKSPKIAYHTLQISDTLVKREGKPASGESADRPKHVCRGNFAHYTEENKLFGKYTGMFWRPMHIRGNAKHGIVGKEYAIAAPVDTEGEP